MKLIWKMEPFGRDCMGNPSGYRVATYQGGLQVAAAFVADIYKAGSHQRAKQRAEDEAARLNLGGQMRPFGNRTVGVD